MSNHEMRLGWLKIGFAVGVSSSNRWGSASLHTQLDGFLRTGPPRNSSSAGILVLKAYASIHEVQSTMRCSLQQSSHQSFLIIQKKLGATSPTFVVVQEQEGDQLAKAQAEIFIS
jgi:hypothetical protein